MFDVALLILEKIGWALWGLLTQPFYYLGLILLMLYFHWQVKLERGLFHVKLHEPIKRWFYTVLWGWFAGLMTSVCMLALGSQLQPEAGIWLWAMTLLLGFMRIRFFCFSYAAGILSLLQVVASFFEEATVARVESQILPVVWNSLVNIHAPSLLALSAIIHLMEAMLLRLQGMHMTTPLYVEGKRGKPVGVMQVQGMWAVPVFLLVPGQSSVHLAWTPWYGDTIWQTGWTWLAFPILMSFTAWSHSHWPEWIMKRNSLRIVLFSLLLLAMAMGAELLSWLVIPAALTSLFIHELFNRLDRLTENGKTSLYVHDERGLMVLDVIPGSPAAELGIVTGEIVRRVNGMHVQTQAQLHEAIRQNSAFVKLEVINRQGESKFLQRAIYAGEHHQLGMILAPDMQTQHVAEVERVNGFVLFGKHVGGLRKRVSPHSGQPEGIVEL